MGNWRWRGHEVYYQQQGQTGPALLLVHGFGASTKHWRYNLPILSQQYRTFAIDLLGFGQSAKPNLAYDGDLWRDQLRDFCQEIIQAPVVVIGNSLGGYAALSVAADHPELIQGVVLLNGAGPFEASAPAEGWQAAVQGVFRQRWASDLLFETLRARPIIRRVLISVYKDPRNVNDELVEDIYRPSCDPGAAQVFARVFSSPQGRTLAVLLQKLQVPLLLLWGELDPWMAPGRAQRFCEYYPQAKIGRAHV